MRLALSLSLKDMVTLLFGGATPDNALTDDDGTPLLDDDAATFLLDDV